MAFLPEYDQFRVQNLDRKRKLAEALKQTQMPQGQMVGGMYVAPSITQYLASALQQYQGNKQLRDIDQQQEQILSERQRTMSEASQRLADALKPRTQESMVGGMPVMEERQPTPQELMQAQFEYAQMIQDPNAMNQVLGNQMNYQIGQQTRQDEREFRSSEAEANRQQRMQELMLRMEDSRLSREQQMEARRELAQMNIEARREIAGIAAANRPEKMVTILGPEGMPVMVPQSQAVGMTPYSPSLAIADAKAKEKEAKLNQQQEGAIAQADRIIGTVGSALNKVSRATAGTGFAATPKSLETVTGARDLAADLETIKANLGFAELQAMRAASPTGGALGQIAVQELVALQSTIASLDQAQSPEQLKNKLAQVRKHYENWKNAVQKSESGQQDTMPSNEPMPQKPVKRFNPATGRIE